MCNKTAYHKYYGNKFNHYGGYQARKAWAENFKAAFNRPPANVRELDDKYELHLFAPGFVKEDFLIALLDQNLSISVDQKNEDQGEWKRREYAPKAFTRQFELNEKIDKSAIEAKYEAGVLILTLPKLEGFETQRQEVKVN